MIALPFTPFHLGPALLLGMMFLTTFNLPTVLISSVIPDLEPFLILYFNIPGYPLHGFFHSYFGSSILTILVAGIVYPLRNLFNRALSVFQISQKSSFKNILFTSFVGTYSHVFLDSFLYGEMMPFYPFTTNPFLFVFSDGVSYAVVYGFCTMASLVGVFVYIYRIVKKAKA